MFADLATVDDADGVVAAVARALGVTAPGRAAVELARRCDGRVDRR